MNMMFSGLHNISMGRPRTNRDKTFHCPFVPRQRNFLVPVSLCPGTKSLTILHTNFIFLLHFYQKKISPPAICLLHNEPSLVCLLIELQGHFCFEWNSLVAKEINWVSLLHSLHCSVT